MQAADVAPPASTPAPAAVPSAHVETKGRHRLMAEIKKLEQETRSLEEELEELGKTDNVSKTLPRLLHIVEKIPDPLLPETVGPKDPSWDRWFEGSQDIHGGSRCSIL